MCVRGQVQASGGFEDKLKIISFGNLHNLNKIAENKDWFGDGTFNVSPLVCKNGKILPIVYALSPNKAQQA